MNTLTPTDTFTAEEAIAAFNRHPEIKPDTMTFYNGEFACACGIVSLDRHPQATLEGVINAALTEWEPGFRNGVTLGFLGYRVDCFDNDAFDAFNEGYKVGCAVREEMVRQGRM